jgi:hypothetical protein
MVTNDPQPLRHYRNDAVRGCSLSDDAGWYVAAEMPTLEHDVQAARDRFVAWMRWYMKMYPKKAPTITALAELLGFSSHSGLTQLLNSPTRLPDFRTVIAARERLGIPLDSLLRDDPPDLGE